MEQHERDVHLDSPSAFRQSCTVAYPYSHYFAQHVSSLKVIIGLNTLSKDRPAVRRPHSISQPSRLNVLGKVYQFLCCLLTIIIYCFSQSFI